MPYINFLLLTVSVFSLSSFYAFAQETVPAAADPARQGISNNQIVPHFDLQPRTMLRSNTSNLSPDIASVRFFLNSLRVEGVQAFDQALIEKEYEKYLGREISVTTLFGILDNIQQLYLDEGYALSKVSMPEQNIQSGHIRFEAVEGFIDDVEVGQDLPKAPIIDDFVSEVLAMKPLNVKKLERMMLVINDRPGTKVTSILEPVENKAQAKGAVKLIFQNNQSDKDASRPISASLGFDNYGSVFSGPGQVDGVVQIKDAGLNLSDLKLDARVTTSLRELRQSEFEYTQPIFGVSGTNIKLKGSASYTNPGASLDILDAQGRSQSFGIGIEYPLIRQRHKNLIIGAEFSYKNSETDLLQTEIFNDRLRTISGSIDFSVIDSLKGINFINASFSKGLDILDSSQTGSDNLSRIEGQSDFEKFNFGYARLQIVTPEFDLFFSAQGQFTNDPLLSSEEIGYGGMAFGRGYDPSEITGDRGIVSSVEARYTVPNEIPHMNIQPFLFYDIGKVWNIDPSAKNKISGASAGGGIRFRHDQGWSFDATLAAPLTLKAANPPKYTDEKGLRALFRLKKEF